MKRFYWFQGRLLISPPLASLCMAQYLSWVIHNKTLTGFGPFIHGAVHVCYRKLSPVQMLLSQTLSAGRQSWLFTRFKFCPCEETVHTCMALGDGWIYIYRRIAFPRGRLLKRAIIYAGLPWVNTYEYLWWLCMHVFNYEEWTLAVMSI